MESPPSPPTDDGARPDVRAFWVTFAVCGGTPVLLFALTTVLGGDLNYGALFYGGMLMLIVDVSFLIPGIARPFGDKPGGWGTVLGALAGVLVGFSGCATLMGAV